MIINENSQCVRGSRTHKLIISQRGFSSHCSNVFWFARRTHGFLVENSAGLKLSPRSGGGKWGSAHVSTIIKRYSCGGNWDKHPEFHPKTSHVLRWFIEHKWAGYCLFFPVSKDQRHPMILVPSSSCHQRCLVILLAHSSPRKVGSQMQ